jgi:hypothetical protein
MANYSDAFSNSFASNTFVTESIPGVTDSFKQDIDLSNIDFNKAANLEFNPIAFNSGLDLLNGSPTGWTFITAPEDVSWDIANNAQRIDIFGTNNPPVVAGSRGMRDLTLSNSLVEGFVRNVQVEGKVAALESLMDYGLNSSDGFVSVPVYQVWANEKSYGGPEAYYIIKDVKVKETMRDLKGNATRAYVDISLMQVPAFQVNSGRDQASAVTSGAKSGLISEAQTRSVQQAEAAKNTKGTAAASAKGNQGVGVTQPKSGPGVGTTTPKDKPASAPTTGRQVGISRAPR